MHGFDVSYRSAVGGAGATPAARRAASIAKAVGEAELVITMLPEGRHVRGVYMDPGRRVRQRAKPAALLIDCSTIDVETARTVAAAAAARGFAMLDAPVSGGVAGAEAGTLTFMVGGSAGRLRAGAAAAGRRWARP